MAKLLTTTNKTLENAVANICCKTGLSPAEVLKAFDGLVMMGLADRRKVQNIKDKLQHIPPNLFH